MWTNLLLGTILISLTVFIHTVGLVFLSRLMTWIVHWFQLHRHDVGKTGAIMATVFGLFFLHTIEIWLWAIVFVSMNIVNGFDNALYFSTVNFSTVGTADMTAPDQWRILVAFESINGFILIGWSSAYLINASTRHGPFRSGEHF